MGEALTSNSNREGELLNVVYTSSSRGALGELFPLQFDRPQKKVALEPRELSRELRGLLGRRIEIVPSIEL
jgi:hypothetical protein